MRGLMRKLRGALGTALVWAVGWGLSGFAVASISFLFRGFGAVFWETVRPVTLLASLSGFVGGGVFSLILGAIPWKRSLRDFNPKVMALVGAGAGLLVPLALLGVGLLTGAALEADVVGVLAVGVAGLGAITGGGTIWLAQQGDKEIGPPDGGGGRLGPGT